MPMFHRCLERLRAVVDRPKSRQVTVDTRDLLDLLHNFDRLDSEVRSFAEHRDRLYAALVPVAEDADREGRLATIWDSDWNPDAHYPSITLTIGEVRAILTALAKARGGGDAMNATLFAFHGDPAIKERYLARARAHRAADDIIRDTYGGLDGVSDWRGCAVGCMLNGDDHAAFESELGIPMALGHLEDALFEEMPDSAYRGWPVEFLEVIPVGADLSLVVWQLLARGIRDLLRFAADDTRPAMERVLAEVLEPRARGEFIGAGSAGAYADYAAAAAEADDAYAAYAIAAVTYNYAYAAAAAAYSAAAAVYANAAAAYRDAAAYIIDAAAAAIDTYATADADIRWQMAYEWSRWLLELMAAAPVPARGEVTK